MATASELRYQLEIAASIRGHHIYKSTWTPTVCEVFIGMF